MEINSGTLGFGSVILGCLGVYNSYNTYKKALEYKAMGIIRSEEESIKISKESNGIDTNYMYIPVSSAYYNQYNENGDIVLGINGKSNCNDNHIQITIPKKLITNYVSDEIKNRMTTGIFGRWNNWPSLFLQIPTYIDYRRINMKTNMSDRKIQLIEQNNYQPKTSVDKIQNKFDDVAKSMMDSANSQGIFGMTLMLFGAAGIIHHKTKK